MSDDAALDGEIVNIAELYVRDPHNLSDKDIRAIIEDQRARRKQFNLNAVGGKPKAKAAPKKLTKAEEAVKDLDLGDLKL